MLSLARVRFDPFETEAVKRLNDYLKEYDVALVLDQSHIRKDIPILHHINPHIRISNIPSVIAHQLGMKCNVIYSKNIPISYMLNENGCPFYTAGTYWYYDRPPVDEIPILMVVHSRDMYLKLTLNSLAYSLGFDNQVPVHIMLSQPTEEVRNTVFSFKDKLNLSVYEAEENVCFAGHNLLLQHLKPEKFIILEEDYILPQNLRLIMPYWVRVFNERLNYFDVVGFSTSIENSSANHFNLTTKTTGKNTFVYEWINNSHAENHVTGNTLCTTTKHYLTCSMRNGPFYITPDGILMSKSSTSICSITGYHIGFNQEMDYSIALNNSGRFPSPKENQTMFDYQKDQKFEYNLKDVYKLLDHL